MAKQQKDPDNTQHPGVTYSNFSTKDSDSAGFSVLMLFRADTVKVSGLWGHNT